MLNNAPAVVLPPDTGYELKTADAFYAAVAAVLGGQATRRTRWPRSTARSAADPGPRSPSAAGAIAARRPIRSAGRLMKPARSITPWLFLAPALAMFAFAVLLPMVLTVGYSFTEWNGFGPMTFVGLDNYLTAATDPIFRGSFVHVCLYIAATLVLEVLVGLVLAGIVSAVDRPAVVPGRDLHAGDAADGRRRGVVGVRLQPRLRTRQRDPRRRRAEQLQRVWLGDPATALAAVSVVSGWVYAGFYMMIFYAAFRQIPHEILEAGRLDGAGSGRCSAG